MERKEEAVLSQSIISLKKTIYVEGKLDFKTIKCFLDSKKIKNVKIIEINEEVDDSHLPIEERYISKDKIINLVKKANRDKSVYSEYLGIIDLDYDFFNGKKEKVKNLIYTDFNSIETYFLNNKLINEFLLDFDVNKLETVKFDDWLKNSLLFSFYFYFQISSIANLDNNEVINFRELRLCNPTFVDLDKGRIRVKNIVSAKTDCSMNVLNKFTDFFFEQDRSEIYANSLLFLHGKYTLKYVICLLKKKFEQLKYLSFDTIVINLKDKFMLYEYYNVPMFNKILEFARK